MSANLPVDLYHHPEPDPAVVTDTTITLTDFSLLTDFMAFDASGTQFDNIDPFFLPNLLEPNPPGCQTPPSPPHTHSTVTNQPCQSDISTDPIAPVSVSKSPKKKTRSRKVREEFSHNDLKALLNAVLEVNPWLCAYGETNKKWDEVKEKVDESGACVGRSADTLKQKVITILKSVEVIYLFFFCFSFR